MRIRTHAIPTWAALACALIGLSACEEPQAEQTVAPAQVSVITLQPAPRPYIRELPGRIAPTRVAEVRARVAGIVLERSFQQGADVKAGDVLYRIDPVRFQVELKAAEAALAQGPGRARAGRAASQAGGKAGQRAGGIASPARKRDRGISSGASRCRRARGGGRTRQA